MARSIRGKKAHLFPEDSMLFALLSLLALSPQAQAAPFHCGKLTQPGRALERPLSCDDTGGYDLLTPELLSRPELIALFGVKPDPKKVEADPQLKDKALEARFRLTSNMNGARFDFPSGVSRVVFRGAYHAPQFTPLSVLRQAPGEKDKKVSCMRELVGQYKLAKIVNYDELDWKSAEILTEEERDLLLRHNRNATYWEFTKAFGRTFQYKFAKVKGDTLEERKAAVMRDVVRIIREIEGDPTQEGAVYIHCYGGHHRTGAVYGVLQKCFGKMPVNDIIDEYKCHIGYESPEKPGGYHADNEALIREFPCDRYFGN
jgi:hypothetical protein